jgi:hypothetical protein
MGAGQLLRLDRAIGALELREGAFIAFARLRFELGDVAFGEGVNQAGDAQGSSLAALLGLRVFTQADSCEGVQRRRSARAL